ncbi:putative cell surface protein [Myxococcus hansupus]|uniref:Putative cell surface protein n=2 Tax=Pseudomyxococcus hansupus TaxID=1297742 RepID=A0A0H4WUK5_9BACT|nr:putative cell surface protein [Myxococcus hansupus]
MRLATFQSLAGQNTTRCVGGITMTECQSELAYAYSQQLITQAAYSWGMSTGFYPVVDRHNQIGAVCKCGCFEADTQILTQDADGFRVWLSAKSVRSTTELISLDETTNLTTPGFLTRNIVAMSQGKESPSLFVFTLDNGRQLKVTQNHGMLLSNGRVVEAKTVRVGDEFVGLEGEIVTVRNLTFEHTAFDVYNFEVNAEDKAGHFLAAEGVLVGDLAWQNQLSRELGAIAVRR